MTTLKDLKAAVSIHLTADEVRVFGDLRKTVTWQAALDSISIVAEVPVVATAEVVAPIVIIDEPAVVVEPIVDEPEAADTDEYFDPETDADDVSPTIVEPTVDEPTVEPVAAEVVSPTIVDEVPAEVIDEVPTVEPTIVEEIVQPQPAARPTVSPLPTATAATTINHEIPMILILTALFILATRIIELLTPVLKVGYRVAHRTVSRRTVWLNEVRNLYGAY